MNLEENVGEIPYAGSDLESSGKQQFQYSQLTEPPKTYGVCGLTCSEDYNTDDEEVC